MLRLNGNQGRDHRGCMSIGVLLAGGGIRGGQVCGASESTRPM
ncbi:MAG: DUF1501 domain-containing protein [Gemmataceae bacterium]|nr:DUF1501 domain-containing protein [Gemmataceae bacterium]